MPQNRHLKALILRWTTLMCLVKACFVLRVKPHWSQYLFDLISENRKFNEITCFNLFSFSQTMKRDRFTVTMIASIQPDNSDKILSLIEGIHILQLKCLISERGHCYIKSLMILHWIFLKMKSNYIAETSINLIHQSLTREI